MNKRRTFKARELEKLLFSIGFEKVRQKGSHVFYKNHTTGKRTTIPHHKGKDLAHSLLRIILRDIDISIDEFYKIHESL